jgi:hypothetical protein
MYSHLPFSLVDLAGHALVPTRPDGLVTLDELKALPGLLHDLNSLGTVLGMLSALPSRTLDDPADPSSHDLLHRLRFLCAHCGHDVHLDARHTIDGVVRVMSTPCPHPEGLPVVTLSLDVPSGRLVAVEDVRSLLPLPPTARVGASPFTPAAFREESMLYEKEGMVHLQIHDVTPVFYLSAQGLLSVVSDGNRKRAGTCLGYLPIDGRTLSLLDAEDYEALCQKAGRKPDPDILEMAVTPGNWTFSVDYRTLGQRRDHADNTFAKGCHTGPCLGFVRSSPVVTCLQESHLWSTLAHAGHSTRMAKSPLEMLTHAVLVNGNGYDWAHGVLNDQGAIRDVPAIHVAWGQKKEDSPVIPPAPPELYGAIARFDADRLLAPNSTYPQSDGQGLLADAPLQADLYWVSACLIVLKSLKNSEALSVTHGGGIKAQTRHLDGKINHLCHIITLSGRTEEALLALEETAHHLLPLIESGVFPVLAPAKVPTPVKPSRP